MFAKERTKQLIEDQKFEDESWSRDETLRPFRNLEESVEVFKQSSRSSRISIGTVLDRHVLGER